MDHSWYSNHTRLLALDEASPDGSDGEAFFDKLMSRYFIEENVQFYKKIFLRLGDYVEPITNNIS